MIVLLPYVPSLLREETLAAVEEETASVGWDFRQVEIDPNDLEHYFRVLNDHWREGDGLTVVEHDIVPPAGAFSQFASCPEHFCAFPYPCSGSPVARNLLALGCTRFSKELVTSIPEAVELAGEISEDAQNLGKRHWKRMDVRLYRVLIESFGDYRHLPRYQTHPHGPEATHLHDYKG